jgi:pimeloyl-ACP methyl ester carboxylesterase
MTRGLEIASGSIATLTNERWLADAGSSLPTALFVPGYTGSKEDFVPLFQGLAFEGIRAVAIDQRGQFESSWANDATSYTIESLAEDVLEIIDEISRNSIAVHLVGHSFGGLVSRAAVLHNPTRLFSLTLMDSGPGAIVGRRLSAVEAAEPVLATAGLAAVWDLISSPATADPKFASASPAQAQFLQRRFMANDPLGLQVMGSQLRTVIDRTAELALVELPMLVLHGENDDAWPPELQKEMACRLGAEHRVIPAAAHSPAVENPAATVKALIEFWRSL